MATPLLLAGETAAAVTSRFWPMVRSLGGQLGAAVLAEYAVSTGKNVLDEADLTKSVSENPMNIFPFVAAIARHGSSDDVAEALTDLMDRSKELKISKEVLDKLSTMVQKVKAITEATTGDGETGKIWGMATPDVDTVLASFAIAKIYIKFLISITGSLKGAERLYNAVHVIEPAHFDLYARYA